MQQRVFYMA